MSRINDKDEKYGLRTSNRFNQDELLAIQRAATQVGLAGANVLPKFNRIAIITMVEAQGVEWPKKTEG